MADGVLRLAGDRIDLGEIDFRRRFLVIGPQSVADFVTASQQSVAQATQLLDPMPGGRQPDGGAIGALRPVNPIDVVDVIESRFRRWW
jgi:hypothetical protein